MLKITNKLTISNILPHSSFTLFDVEEHGSSQSDDGDGDGAHDAERQTKVRLPTELQAHCSVRLGLGLQQSGPTCGEKKTRRKLWVNLALFVSWLGGSQLKLRSYHPLGNYNLVR